MNTESLDRELFALSRERKAARAAPWLVSGDTAAALIFGYTVLGQYVVALGLPEPLSVVLLLVLVGVSLRRSERRFAHYLAGGVLMRTLGALAIAAGLALLTLALGILLGSKVPDPLVVLFLWTTCILYKIYQWRLTQRLFDHLVDLPRWLSLAKLLVIVGATVLAITTLSNY